MATRTKPRTRSNGAAPRTRITPEAKYARARTRFTTAINRAREDLAIAAERAFGDPEDRPSLPEEWASYSGEVLDPSRSRLDQRDNELFSEVQHPTGYVEMHASRTVTAGAHSEGDLKGPRSGKETFLELSVARNIAGNEELMLIVECNDIEITTAGRFTVTLEALVGLATLLPRVVEMARREGLLGAVPHA
jgi:hypothetical protein